MREPDNTVVTAAVSTGGTPIASFVVSLVVVVALSATGSGVCRAGAVGSGVFVHRASS